MNKLANGIGWIVLTVVVATPKAFPKVDGGGGVSPTPPDMTSRAHQPQRGFRRMSPTRSRAT